MRLSRPRFTVRRLMIGVAACALLLWPAILALRWEAYRRRALQYEEVARTLSSELITIRARGGPESEAKMRELALFDQMREAEKYRRAMQRPWLGL